MSDIQYVCYRLIRDYLKAGESSLGIHVSIDQLGPRPLGAEVTARVPISNVDGRKIALNAKVLDTA